MEMASTLAARTGVRTGWGERWSCVKRWRASVVVDRPSTEVSRWLEPELGVPRCATYRRRCGRASGSGPVVCGGKGVGRRVGEGLTRWHDRSDRRGGNPGWAVACEIALSSRGVCASPIHRCRRAGWMEELHLKVVGHAWHKKRGDPKAAPFNLVFPVRRFYSSDISAPNEPTTAL